LIKPFSPDELRARVGNLLALKRTRDVLQRELASQRGELETLAQDLVLRKQEAEAANRTKDEFLSNAAHEFKTPMTSLKGTVEFALIRIRRASVGVDGGDQAVLAALAGMEKLFQNSNDQIRRLTRLVDDLLDVSRIQTGKLRLNLELCDLAGIVREAV